MDKRHILSPIQLEKQLADEIKLRIEKSLSQLQWHLRAALKLQVAVDNITELKNLFHFSTDTVKSALFHASIVSYADPFSGNVGKNNSKHVYKKSYIAGGAGWDDAIHGHICDIRNKMIAHTDASVNEVKVSHQLLFAANSLGNFMFPAQILATTTCLMYPKSMNDVVAYHDHMRAAYETCKDTCTQYLDTHVALITKNPEYFMDKEPNDRSQEYDLKEGVSVKIASLIDQESHHAQEPVIPGSLAHVFKKVGMPFTNMGEFGALDENGDFVPFTIMES